MVVVQSFTTVLLKTHWGISCGEVYTTFGRFAPKPTVILSYHFHDFSKRRVSFVGYCPIKDGKENFIIVEHIQKDHSWTREFTQSKHDKHRHSTVTFLWKKTLSLLIQNLSRRESHHIESSTLICSQINGLVSIW